MLRTYSILFISLIISGCGTMRPPQFEDQAWVAVNGIDADTKKNIEGVAAQKFNGNTCKTELCKAYLFADFYRKQYLNLSSDAYALSSTVDILSLIAGLAGTTAVAFDWHKDALTASALTLGASMGFKSYSQPNQRANLYLQAAERMQCIVDTNSQILTDKIDDETVQSLKEKIENSFINLDKNFSQRISKLKIDVAKLTNSSRKEFSEKTLKTYDDIVVKRPDIMKQLYRNISLVQGMPNHIISSTRKADLIFRKKFSDSSPDLNESLRIIQNSVSNKVLTNEQNNQLSLLFENIKELPETSEKGAEKATALTPQELTFLDIVELNRQLIEIKQNIDSMKSRIINYTDSYSTISICSSI